MTDRTVAEGTTVYVDGRRGRCVRRSFYWVGVEYDDEPGIDWIDPGYVGLHVVG